jgi:hypothetical protein
MSGVKKQALILNKKQIEELKWFCANVVGVRSDFYPVREQVQSFEARLKRLERTCRLIEKHLSEIIEAPLNFEGLAHDE